MMRRESWKSSKVQMERILKPEVELPFTLKEAQKYRTQLVHNSYKRFEEKKGNPSGKLLPVYDGHNVISDEILFT